MNMQSSQPVVSIDDLARDKVREIEEVLSHGTDGNFRSDTFATWFAILKQIITAADLHRTNDDKPDKSQQAAEQNGKGETGDSIYADYSDDNEQFTAQVDLSEQFANNSVKWTIRVQAFKLVHRLVNLVIDGSNDSKSQALLAKHLSDLVRLSFVAATSPYDELKVQGFEMFRLLIERFAAHEEKEFPGHSILEQYKTQFLSAVKPAFNLDAPPYITAIASQICSLWICQGLEKNPNDVKRTYQLMLLSIEKLEGQSVNQHSKLYTESELEQERVDILGAWAQLYISSKESNVTEPHVRLSRLSKQESDNLSLLVRPQIKTLVDKWWEAMKDYALLIMPAPKIIGTSHDNENVYTREVALRLFASTWPKIAFALSLWLCAENDSGKDKYCKFLSGVLMKELSRCLMDKNNPRRVINQSTTLLAIRSLNVLLSNDLAQRVFVDNLAIAQEFYRTLYQITVMHSRDPNRPLLRQTLDLLYKLTVERIITDKRNVHYGLAKLISSLMCTMKDMEIASNEKSPIDLDINKFHLSIRLKNLLTLIKSAPVVAMEELPLQVALIAVFQELLRFKPEPTVGVTSADQLKELLSSVEDQLLRAHILDELFPELSDRIESLMTSLLASDKYTELDRLHLSHADSFLKSMRLSMDQVSDEACSTKISSYVRSVLITLETCDKNIDAWTLSEAKKRRELLDFAVSHCIAIQKLRPDAEITPESKGLLDSAIQLQQDIKSKLDIKNQKHQSPTKPSNSKPKVAKIALKADFSNFYAKKANDKG